MTLTVCDEARSRSELLHCSPVSCTPGAESSYISLLRQTRAAYSCMESRSAPLLGPAASLLLGAVGGPTNPFDVRSSHGSSTAVLRCYPGLRLAIMSTKLERPINAGQTTQTHGHRIGQTYKRIDIVDCVECDVRGQCDVCAVSGIVCDVRTVTHAVTTDSRCALAAPCSAPPPQPPAPEPRRHSVPRHHTIVRSGWGDGCRATANKDAMRRPRPRAPPARRARAA